MTFYNAGRIPGSAHVLVNDGETRLLYTGDFHVDGRRGDQIDTRSPCGQRLVSGTTARPDADAFRRAISHARFVTGRNGRRRRITDQKAAIITTSGTLGNEDSLAVAA